MSLNIRLGLLGLGTVGCGLVRLIRKRQERLLSSFGIRLEIVGAAVRNPDKPRPKDIANVPLVADPFTLVRSPDVDIVVDIMGGGIETILSVVKEALIAKKSVVTGDTALLAHHGPELLALASETGVSLFGEASVGGGIPILKTLRESLAADEITSLTGIVNSTTNYILTRMDEDRISQFEALRMASDRGYPETDPSLDLDGIDAKHKLQVLAAHLCSGVYPNGEILREGIAEITEKDFFYARKRNMTIKLLAIAKRDEQGIELRVHPTLVPRIHPLAAVRDQLNAVLLKGDAVGEIMLLGEGAGAMPAAASVLADIVDIATRTARPDLPGKMCPPKPFSIHPPDEIESGYYLRATVEDKPGIIGEIATILGRHGISVSLASAELIPNADGLGDMEIAVHKTREKLIRDALSAIDRLSGVRGKTRVLRIDEAPPTGIVRRSPLTFGSMF